MTSLDFLSRVLPDLPTGSMFGPAGIYYAVSLADGKPYQSVCASRQAIVDHCMQWSSQGRNAYMALCAFGDSTKGRKQVNAVRARCLWADIDAGKKTATYANASEAAAAVVNFRTVTGLVPSIVVSSGMGLHVYWQLAHDVDIPTWRTLAATFHQVCVKHGLDVDPTRAEDCASILRLPGTAHIKSGKTVDVLWDDAIQYDPDDLLRIMKGMVGDVPVKSVPVPVEKTVTNPLFDAEMDAMGLTQITAPRRTAKDVAASCKQILLMGSASYGAWYYAMTVLKCCDGGHEAAHILSRSDPRYDINTCESKWNATSDNMPTSCAHFAAERPDLCQGCVMFGQGKNPLMAPVPSVVPVESTEPVAVVKAPASDGSLDLSNTHAFNLRAISSTQFRVDADGVWWLETVKDKAAEAFVVEPRCISTVPLYFKYIAREEKSQREPKRHYIFEARHADGHSEDLAFIPDQHLNVSKVQQWFANGRMFPSDGSYPAKVYMDFINAYLASIARDAVEIDTIDHFGWTMTEDPATHTRIPAFALPQGIVSAAGVKLVKPAPDIAQIASEFSAKGSLDDWRFGVNLYKTLGQYAGQLGVVLSLAAPFMKYGLGEAKSATYSLWSDVPGKGKSHVLRCAASVWGDPSQQLVQRNTSSVAIQRRLAILHNVPVMCDELTDVSDDVMYGLAYTLAGGKEKSKLRSSGDGFIKTGDWQTVTYATANKSFKTAIAAKAGDSEATLLRVIEFDCDFKSYADSPDLTGYINACMAAVKNNYGRAGAEFIHRLLKSNRSLDTIPTLVEHWVNTVGFESAERFISSPLAIAIIIGKWAVEEGIIDYDMDALESWVIGVLIPHNRRATKHGIVTPEDAMREYLADRQLNTLIVTDNHRNPDKQRDPGVRGMPDAYVKLMPTRELRVRVEYTNSTVIFNLNDFREWCKARNLTADVVLRKLRDHGIGSATSSKNLAYDVSYISLPRCKCIVLDRLSVERLGYDMKGLVTATKEAAKAESK